MKTDEIVQDIINYSENTILFRPNLTSRGLGAPIQLKRALKMDIANAKPTDNDSYKLYELDDVEQACQIIAGVYQKQKKEIKPEVEAFIQQNGVDTSRPLYLIAYLVEATKEENDLS